NKDGEHVTVSRQEEPSMHLPLRFATMTCLILCVITVASVPAQRAATAAPPSGAQADVTARIATSAQALLTKLDDAGRAKVQFPFEGPQKTRWSNLPTSIVRREGVRMGDLTSTQRAAVKELLAVALSRDGYRKVTEIMQGDEVLRNAPSQGQRAGGRAGGRGGPGGNPMFGEDEDYLAFLGTPSPTSPGMLQFGGHHLAINLTLAGSQATMAPSLPATQPATFTVEGRTVRPLGNENDKAFALINALSAEQRR